MSNLTGLAASLLAAQAVNPLPRPKLGSSRRYDYAKHRSKAERRAADPLAELKRQRAAAYRWFVEVDRRWKGCQPGTKPGTKPERKAWKRRKAIGKRCTALNVQVIRFPLSKNDGGAQ
jgi:hypothetical protein